MNPTCGWIYPNLHKCFGRSWPCPKGMPLSWQPLRRAGAGPAHAGDPGPSPLAGRGMRLGRFSQGSGSVRVRRLPLGTLTDLHVGWQGCQVPSLGKNTEVFLLSATSPLVSSCCLSWGRTWVTLGGSDSPTPRRSGESRGQRREGSGAFNAPRG